jgi:AcrR family transcriptional regulator
MAEPVKAPRSAVADATRQALLEAGRRLLLDQPATRAFSHLTANRVATEAGRTTGALFHQWPTLEAYMHDLIALVFAPSQSETFPAIAAAILEVFDKSGSLHDAIVAGSHDALRASPHDPHTIVELLTWNRAARDDEFRATVAPHYDALDAMGGEFIEGLLALAGREMRPPFTPDVFAAVCAGMVQGIAIREVMTPGYYPPDILGWILITLTPLFTRIPDEDPQTAQDLVARTPLLAPAPDAPEASHAAPDPSPSSGVPR